MGTTSVFTSIASALHPTCSIAASSSSCKTFFAASIDARLGDLAAIQSELSHDLDRLMKHSIKNNSAITCDWVCQALSLIIRSHASMEVFVPELKTALASGDTTWFDGYLNHSSILLDTCISLQSSMEDLRLYHSLVDSAIKSLMVKRTFTEAQLRRANNVLSKCVIASKGTCTRNREQCRCRLVKCTSVLKKMSEKLISTQETTFKRVPSSVSGSHRSKSKPSTDSDESVTTGLWPSSFGRVQHKGLGKLEHSDKKTRKGGLIFLKEVQKTDMEVCMLQDVIGKMLGELGRDLPATRAHYHADDVRKFSRSLIVCLEDLGQGLGALEFYVHELYEVLITSRMALLEIYKDSQCLM